MSSMNTPMIRTPFGWVPRAVFGIWYSTNRLFQRVSHDAQIPTQDRRYWSRAEYEREREQLRGWVKRLVEKVIELKRMAKDLQCQIDDAAFELDQEDIREVAVTPFTSVVDEGAFGAMGWDTTPITPNLRTQTSPNVRAAVVQLSRGLFLIGEVPSHVAASNDSRDIRDYMERMAATALSDVEPVTEQHTTRLPRLLNAPDPVWTDALGWRR
jgi:hypothetical protein